MQLVLNSLAAASRGASPANVATLALARRYHLTLWLREVALLPAAEADGYMRLL
eukprot:CAMPEP_0170754862 /NCGR_PEP_ID=MMETSP0437-20130122/13221_1 /TAXON_ID=0 /ORGANISM="Sexangularia sp." /LENGTH=53 /DNA_ID=CAMNT_0011094013 /DNA_START=1 /DNA_END=158 /DNA_ORIENTATION=-